MTRLARGMQAAAGGLLAVAAVAMWLAVTTPDPALAADPFADALMRWRHGTAQQYRLAMTSTVHIGGEVTAPDPIVQTVRGVLAFRTLECTPETAVVGMQLGTVELSIGGASDADIARALTTPFRVRFAQDGRAIEFMFSNGLDPSHAALLEEVVRTFEIVVGTGREWTKEAAHATGRYTAHYVRTDAAKVQREKLQYLRRGGEDDGREVEVRGASATAWFASHVDWLAGIAVDETLATRDVSGVAFTVTTHATLDLLEGPTIAVADASTWSLTAAPMVGAAAAADRVAMLPISTEQLAADLNELLAALDAASTGRTVWVHRLRDLLRADARTAGLLLEAMQQRTFADRTRADLFLALELGETEPAQAALARVFSEPDWSQRDRLRALIALGGVTMPSPASVDSLWIAASARANGEQADAANTALLALGALGGRMSLTDSSYARLRDGLLVEANGAPDVGGRTAALLALANTGDRSLAKELAPFLDDRAPAVRAAAAKALGRLDDDAPVLFAMRLENETSSAVRAAMAAALATKPPPPAAMILVRQRVLVEPDEHTRLELARCLGRDLAARSENAATLRALLATEVSDRIRRCAGEALAIAEAAEQEPSRAGR